MNIVEDLIPLTNKEYTPDESIHFPLCHYQKIGDMKKKKQINNIEHKNSSYKKDELIDKKV